VPAEVDLQDFAFMPLDVARLRDSELASNETPEACWAAVLLWAASWHQVPAASIPNDDRWIAKTAGYAQRGKIAKEWPEVRAGALRGWVECRDGRLYHSVVAEKALEAWDSKREQRWKTECARIKKHNDRHGTGLVRPSFDQWLSQGCPQGQPLPVPGDNPPCPTNVPRETHSKGQGEGQGQGQGESVPRSPGPTPTRAGEACLAIRKAGMSATNPGDPRLLALLEAGITPEELAAAAVDAMAADPPKGWAWVLATAEGRRRDASKVRPLPARAEPSKAWEGAS